MNAFSHTSLTLASALVLSTLATPALAQQSPAVTPMPEEIVIIGTRTAVSRNDLPMQVSVITAEQIQNSGSVNVAEILNDSGEIYIRTSGSSGGRITLRGMAHADTLFLIDGIDLNLFTNRGNTSYRLFASHLERNAFTRRETARLSVSNTPISQLSGAAFAPLRAALDDEYQVNRDYQDDMSLSHLSAGLQHRFNG